MTKVPLKLDLPPIRPESKPILQRVLTGLGAAAVVIVITFLPEWGGLPFVLSVSLLSIIGASEFYGAVRKQGAEPSDILGFIACILFQIFAWRRDGNTLDPYLPAGLTLLVLATMLVELVKPKQKPILNIGATLLGAIYCGWLFSFLVLLHGTQRLVVAPIHGTTQGEWLAIFVVAVTSFSDVGGLIAGNLFGRHKLAPNISPSKTWEGLLGSLFLAMVVAGLVAWWIHFEMADALTLAVIIAVVGLTGDLCESALKRELGVKDFGVLLPGHGGILDRIDSILFTAPVSYYFMLFLLHGH